MAQVKMDQIMNKFNALTEKPVMYLTVQNDAKDDIKNLVKSLYDYTKSQEQSGKSKTDQALQKIIVNDFDEEQIWQQIELQNSQRWDQLVWDVANCMSNKNDLIFPVKLPEAEASSVEVNKAVDVISFASDSEVLPLTDTTKKTLKGKADRKTKSSKFKGKPSVVDDQFFKLQEMESFLLKEEKMDSKTKVTDSEDDDNESIDMFENIDSEGSKNEEGNEMMYYDFFNENGNIDDNNDNQYSDDDNDFEEENVKSDRKVRFAEPESDQNESDEDESVIDENKKASEDLDNGGKKSEFELRQQRLKQQISRLEDKTLTEAPWQLKGEINALKRPQNSLLQEVLDFDLTTRPPPIITEQTTLTLEGLIRQRVKDKAWDDVVKKEKAVDDQLLFKKPEVLDQSKSKLSLAQVYETEYLKQKQALSGEVVDENEPESHVEIRDAMNKLFAKLDALCHYHYTPKAPQAEVKIVSNTPAISMEEVAPVATSDATLLAPEEVKRKRKGDLMSKEERSQTDKNRERRRKKKLQRKKGQVTKVTEYRNTKKGVEANDKSLKTSKAFFQQLNDNASSLIKLNSKRNVKNKGQ